MNKATAFFKNIITGFLANFFGQVSNLVFQIVSIPIFLKYWGTIYYGEWLLLSSIPIYFSISDLGLSRVAANEMTIKMAQGEEYKAIEIFNNTHKLLLLFTIILFSCVFGLTYIDNLFHLLNLQVITYEEGRIVLLLFFVYIVFVIQTSVIEGGFRANDYFAKGTLLINIVRTVEQSLIVVSVIIGLKIIGIVVLMLGTRILGTFYLYLSLIKINYKYRIKINKFNIKSIKYLIKPSLTYSLFPLSNAINTQLLRMIVGILLGPTQLVIFTTLRTLNNFIKQGLNLIVYSIWPEISRLYGFNKKRKLVFFHRTVVFISFLMTTICIVLLHYYGEILFNTWTASKIEFDYAFFNLLLISTLFYGIWYSSSIFLIALNKHAKVSLVFFLLNILQFILIFTFVNYYKLLMIAVVFIFLDFIMSVFVLKNTLKLLNDKLLNFLSIIHPKRMKRIFRIVFYG